jgi:hypothetical protein
VVVYLTLLLYGSVAVPLYVAYAMEQAARRRFCRRMAAAAGGAQGQAGWQQQQQQQMVEPITQQQQRMRMDDVLPPATAAAGQELRAPRQQAMQQQQQDLYEHNGHIEADQLLFAEPAIDACSLGGNRNCVARWAVHLLLLLSMLLLCWSVSNAFALQLLPKVLSSQQLDLWCPNKPRLPFVMAGQVYTGGDF